MANEQATMSLPLDLIKPAIEAKVNAAVIEALGAHDQLVMKLVEKIMNQKVSDNGSVSTYNGENTTPWLTWAVMDITKNAIKATINEQLAKNADGIKAAIEAEMRKSKSPLVQTLVSSMAKGIAEAASSKYHITVSFKE
jgi:hypothetical protein